MKTIPLTYVDTQILAAEVTEDSGQLKCALPSILDWHDAGRAA